MFIIANSLFAYYSIMEVLFGKEMIKREDIAGKRILLIGENTVGRIQGKTACEESRETLLERGAKECVVFGLLNGFHISDDRLNRKEYFYGDLSQISELLKEQGTFDTIILMEGEEPVVAGNRLSA